MLASKLSRIRFSGPRIPSGIRSLNRGDNRLFNEKFKALELKRPKSTLIPPVDQTQLVSEKDSLSRELLNYDQIWLIIRKNKLLAKNDSPLRPVLIGFLEIELLKISSGQFEDLDKFFDVIHRLTRIVRGNKELYTYIESNLTNDSFVTLNMLMNPKYFAMYMNKEIEAVFKNDNLPNDQKIQSFMSIIKVAHEIRQQFERKEIRDIQKVIISSSNVSYIMKALSRDQYLKVFVELLELDLDPAASNILKAFELTLLNGSQMEQQVYEFQALRTIEDGETKKLLRTKFLTLYSYDMIKNIVIKYIRAGDTATVDFYIEYLMAKYAMTRELPDVDAHSLTQNLYEILTYYVVKLKNYSSAIEMLQTMRMNNLSLTPRLLHILAATFRGRKMFDATMLILKKAAEVFDNDSQIMDEKARRYIINELLITIREQFPGEPKIFISQFLSMFEGSEVMLNELGIISLIHDGTVRKLSNLGQVLPHFYKAEVSKVFKSKDFPDIFNISETYIAILTYVSIHHFHLPKDQILQELFHLLLKHIEKAQTLDLSEHPFSKQNLDGIVVNVFIKRVLEDTKDVNLASNMLKTALQTCTFSDFNGEAVSRIIYSSELAHSIEIDQLLSLLTELNVPLNFYILAALCLRADRFGEMDQSYFWYKKILDLDVSVNHYRLIQFAAQMEWELPANFDEALLDTEFQGFDERRKFGFEDNRMFINDPEFLESLSATLDQFEK